MRLHRLRLVDFRGVAERDLRVPPDGVTVVVGDNETGKSSLLEAFGLLLELPADSRHGRLREVRPVGRDIGTEVEAEFELGTGGEVLRLRYRKRWFTDRVTELQVRQPDGRMRDLTGREAHDEAARLFAEHVDPTLWAALVVPQEHTAALPAPRAASGVLVALDPIGGSAGGRAGAEDGSQSAAVVGDTGGGLSDRIEREYAVYFTPRGRATGEYARITAELEAARAAVAEAERQAEGVADEVRRAERLERDIERVGTILAERTTMVDRLRAERRLAADLLASVDRRRSAAQLAVERRAAAQSVANARSALIAEVATRVEAMAAANAERDEAVTAARDVEARSAESTVASANAREAEVSARGEAGRAELHLSVLRDRAELVELEAKLVAVTEARDAAQAARAAIERNPVDAVAAERVEQAHRDLGAAHAAVEAGAPRVEIRRLAGAEVSVDGSTVGEDASELVVTDDTVVTVADRAEVVIRPGAGVVELRAGLERARDAEAAVLAELGVPDISAARACARERLAAERDLAAAGQTVAARLGSMTYTDLVEQVESARARCAAAEPLGEPPPSVDAARALVDRARRTLAETSDALELAGLAEAAARKEAEAASERSTEARARVELEVERHEEAVAALERARRENPDESIDAALTAATSAAESAEAELAAAMRRSAESGADRVEQELAAAEQVRGQLVAELDGYRADLRRAEGRLEQAGAQGIASALDRARADAAQTERRYTILHRRACAVQRLRATLERHRVEAHRRYAAPLTGRIEQLGRQVLGPSFGVVLDSDLAVVARDMDGRQIPVTALSTGAREQLATIMRLAIAGLAGSGGEGVPVILDDALGWSDPGRLHAMGTLLAKAGESGQVLLLTCVPERYTLIPGATVIQL